MLDLSVSDHVEGGDENTAAHRLVFGIAGEPNSTMTIGINKIDF